MQLINGLQLERSISQPRLTLNGGMGECGEGMAKLVDLAWGRDVHLGLDLNEEEMEENDVHDQPTPIVKLPQTRDYAQLL